MIHVWGLDNDAKASKVTQKLGLFRLACFKWPRFDSCFESACKFSLLQPLLDWNRLQKGLIDWDEPKYVQIFVCELRWLIEKRVFCNLWAAPHTLFSYVWPISLMLMKSGLYLLPSKLGPLTQYNWAVLAGSFCFFTTIFAFRIGKVCWTHRAEGDKHETYSQDIENEQWNSLMKSTAHQKIQVETDGRLPCCFWWYTS